MALTTLRVVGFRNLASLRLKFSEGVSVLAGHNAQGKTNFLEALYILSNLKSFRTTRPIDLLAVGGDGALIEGTVESPRGSVTLRVTLAEGGRTAAVDGLEPSSAGEYLRVLPSVLFTWEDIRLSLGDPEARRSYLDRAAFAADPAHLRRLRDYGRILRHRNALLREGGTAMDLWEERLSAVGASVRNARGRAAAELSPLIRETYAAVGADGQELTIRWIGDDQDEERLARVLLSDLRANRDHDQRLGFTTVGPHRDSLKVELGGVEARRHASRGQHRSVALSLKVALLVWSARICGEPPLFLLDDPGAELDGRRMSYLGDFLGTWPGQVFLACTEGSRIPLPAGVGVSFHVERGNIRTQ